jgi:hypothetical protein
MDDNLMCRVGLLPCSECELVHTRCRLKFIRFDSYLARQSVARTRSLPAIPIARVNRNRYFLSALCKRYFEQK